MENDDPDNGPTERNWSDGWEKKGRFVIQAVGGAVPFLGGILAAAAAYWSETEQQKINDVLDTWVKMLQDELREKASTISEIVARLDIQDEKISKRVTSDEYQSLLERLLETGLVLRAKQSGNMSEIS